MKELVLALDVTGREEALRVVDEVSDYVNRIKVNYPLVLSAGIEIINELTEFKPVIADFKIADIPYTSSLIAKIAFEHGAESVIAHGFVGSDTLEEICKVAGEYSGKIYVVTELSSPGGQEFMSSVSLKIVKMAKDVGCHGLIAPATRLDRLAEIRKVAGEMEILCPGIGVQGGSLEALRYADGVIVGRSIYESRNPRKTAMELKNSIGKV